MQNGTCGLTTTATIVPFMESSQETAVNFPAAPALLDVSDARRIDFVVGRGGENSMRRGGDGFSHEYLDSAQFHNRVVSVLL